MSRENAGTAGERPIRGTGRRNRTRRLRALTVGLAVGGLCAPQGALPSASTAGHREAHRETHRETHREAPRADLVRATFAGGCFWSMEMPFDKVRGVVSTTSGFAGGTVVNPTYEQVSRGGTGHAEVVQVVFDPRKVSYEQLLEVFWKNVDPLDAGGQFCDRGSHYRSAVFYEGADQEHAALASRESIRRSGRLQGPIVTEVGPLTGFYPAEAYHQDYYLTNVRQYWSYRSGCGRDRRLRDLWGAR